MRRLIPLLAPALLTLLACASAPAPTEAPATTTTTTTTAAIPVDDLAAVKAKLAAGAVLVDVRPAEFPPLRGGNNPYIHRPEADEFAPLRGANVPYIHRPEADESARDRPAVVSAAIPFSEADARIAEFEALVGGDKTKPVVVACGNGSKAVEVKALLLERGFTDVSAQVIADVAAPSPPAP